MNSVKKTAHVTGVFYLAIFFANLFVFLFVSGSLTVAGDAAATAENIRASESSLPLQNSTGTWARSSTVIRIS